MKVKSQDGITYKIEVCKHQFDRNLEIIYNLAVVYMVLHISKNKSTNININNLTAIAIMNSDCSDMRVGNKCGYNIKVNN